MSTNLEGGVNQVEPEQAQPIRLMTLDEIWICEIEKRMQIFDGNKSKVARSLGVTVKTFYNRLHQHGLMEKFRVYSEGAQKWQ